MKTLQIIESAYRCTIEEQDDPAVWIVHAMKGAEADVSVLLRGNAVNYAVANQDASGLTFGDIRHEHPPHIPTEISRLVTREVPVFLVAEDAAERGINTTELIAGVESIARNRLPDLLEKHDQVWHW